tara:strand:+ start:115 stop:369 length:255 start_codon:yes stop_codon:yes gene_type:complete
MGILQAWDTFGGALNGNYCYSKFISLNSFLLINDLALAYRSKEKGELKSRSQSNNELKKGFFTQERIRRYDEGPPNLSPDMESE